MNYLISVYEDDDDDDDRVWEEYGNQMQWFVES